MKLIVGKNNNDKLVYYYLVSSSRMKPKLGEYIVAENSGNYDLIQVIGILETDIKYHRFITNMNVKIVRFSKLKGIIREEE